MSNSIGANHFLSHVGYTNHADVIENSENGNYLNLENDQQLVWVNTSLFERIWRTVLSCLFCGIVDSFQTNSLRLSLLQLQKILPSEEDGAFDQKIKSLTQQSIGDFEYHELSEWSRGFENLANSLSVDEATDDVQNSSDEEDDKLPFYPIKVSFANPSGKNCGFNSWGIICAHALGELADRAIEEIHLGSEEEAVLAENEKVMRDKKSQQWARENVLQKKSYLTGLEKNLRALQEESKQKRKEIFKLIKELEEQEWFRADPVQGKKNPEYQKLMNQKKDLQSDYAREDYLDRQRRELSLQVIQADAALSSENDPIIDVEKEARAIYQQKVADKKRATEVLQILRNGEAATLTEADARTLPRREDFEAGELSNYEWVPGHTSGNLDNIEEFRKVLYGSDWRVIRVGGHGHWWALVKASNGEIIEVNDSSIRRSHWSLDAIFKKWTASGEWSSTQISFYGPGVGVNIK